MEDSDADHDAQEPNADHDAQGPLRVPERQKYPHSAVLTGIRGLRALGLQHLLKREDNEFLVRQKRNRAATPTA
ncbi:hypothetical protein MRX96_019008 [Rhipicephalus microplus]